ncbi:LacI family DNA-binding transcriptional regulator [Halomonas sp. DP5Y7-2]|uniref:LacI family DNA-binding transcriptional regulator n=1 Tax=Halomonas sp. DP5Y7-2 TaxID=2859076 RepID=UPI001C9923D8|nr:LacI family DNA-binding transcriptional regulator [Halomonas sp. DP5Y7-2]MBY5983754.1 LacI family DNA-binding transcriptional regulator [Halomonas sp. DP5Y7-2]
MNQRQHRATILEVAREAGVSKTSVSRYYSGERERLSTAMQERIVAAATALGYQPNPMARGLKGGPSGLIGMLVADIHNPYSVAIMHGVEKACRQAGLSLMLCNSDNDLDQERQQLALLSSYRIEGLVVNAAGRHSDALAQLAASGTPMVLLDRSLKGVDVDEVGLDNATAIDMAIDHLVEQGYTRLLFVSEPPAQASSRQARLERFETQCHARALDAHSLALELKDHQALDAALARHVDHPHPSCAVLCANGQVTLAVARRMKYLGYPLGEIGLMGIDELEWCDLTDPGITTLEQPTDLIGQAAVDCLKQRSSHQATAARRHMFAPTLVPRGSTQRPLATSSLPEISS